MAEETKNIDETKNTNEIQTPPRLHPCIRCKWPYPVGYIQPFTSSQFPTPIPVCAQCALELKNIVHGTNFTHFKRSSAPRAEEFRKKAIKWRENHPELNPQATKTQSQTQNEQTKNQQQPK